MVLPETLPAGQPQVPEEPSSSEWQKWRLGLMGAVGAAVLLVVVVRGALSFGAGATSSSRPRATRR